ncbi:methyl-accepting chemotaxis protein [Chromobacterium piscinae]|uniref:methyl-accepting chemotaxis protein n=1 Tax=Chromobacterium piscinae TaxID=686831 RepID=UPI001407CE2E|nr:methyl-accepting chemotaxis protein [Chromobacterium piscinae]MBX9299199.1 methyl-accepting chemotaxis protein [Chromobacterium vaccinii]MBX9358377.1 methyl-accepting chemotaxis protein [Chromobacterium vaccinii]MCD4502541.1 methyl-accepting chemotaxis protein [Chromobacterium piscinae]NHQ81086.1 methyl-accepting chemotaxis protein [Chromobacterium vaccinii]
MLSQLSVKQKLLAGYGLLIVILAAIVLSSISKLNIIEAQIQDITENRYPKAELANKIVLVSYDVARKVRDAIMASSPQEVDAVIAKIETLRAQNTDYLKELDRTLVSPKGREILTRALQARETLSAQYAPLYALTRANKDAEAQAFLKQHFVPANEGFMKTLTELTAYQNDRVRQAVEDSKSAYRQTIGILLGSAAAALLLSVAVALFISNLVTTPLKKSVTLVRNIQQGDLSGPDEALPVSRDEAMEIARNVQNMRQGLREVVASIQDNANQVSDSAHQLSSMAQQVATSAQRQSEATSEAAATIEQLTVSINHVADNSDQASRQARDAGDLAGRGGHAVQASVGKIQSVSTAVAATSEEMRTLTGEVQRIGNIVTVIRDVADQTNLLALNAAIEAARAGEMGRGFAVVADEVRKLAERTASSAQEITQMIHAIQQGVEKVVGSMDQSLSSVDAVSGSAREASDSMEEIEGSTRDIVGTIGNITSALGEQRTASLSLAQSMEQVSQMAESNSATVEELATTSSELNALSHNLQNVTARFRL